jgi:hypothetical protein
MSSYVVSLVVVIVIVMRSGSLAFLRFFVQKGMVNDMGVVKTIMLL